MAASASALESNSTKPVTLPPPHTHAKRVSSPALQQATTSTLGHGTTPLQPRSSAASGTAERTGLSCGRRAAPCRSSLAVHGIAPRAPPDAAPGASDQPIHTRNRSCLSMPWWLAHQPMMGGSVGALTRWAAGAIITCGGENVGASSTIITSDTQRHFDLHEHTPEVADAIRARDSTPTWISWTWWSGSMKGKGRSEAHRRRHRRRPFT